MYGTNALLACLGITVHRGKTYTSEIQLSFSIRTDILTIEMGISVNYDKAPFGRESRAEHLCTSSTGVCRSQDDHGLRRRDSSINNSH